MLVSKLRKEKMEEEVKCKREESYECLRSYKLASREIADKYRYETEKRFERENVSRTHRTLESIWGSFKSIVTETTRNVCGSYKKTNKRKQTSWWTSEIKYQVKIKKDKWKQYLSHKTVEKYGQYKQQRKVVKELIQREKRKKWEEFGEKMEKDHKSNQKLFYRVLKNARKTPRNDNVLIKDKDGNLLKEDTAIMERWRGYFDDLLNEEGFERDVEQEIGETQELSEEEEGISMEELKKAINTLKNGKAAGCDRITA
ncbi:uncharacterized protein LOC123313963 [Coccinella septempunctata]|uniref:uncharacterized protein LOC123313963 n=1 Tax=Coccinella septempunctata TaxID=41139 RepID=UPI001D062695|nr:uncharacterized protein LOC123313963 [Coccinella septempunctata]